MKFLALGDSYTIGEQVPEEQNFPHQLYRLLLRSGMEMSPPHIIAATGWTTDELLNGIRVAESVTPLDNGYDLVTLLIGVNNQYRGRSLENYGSEFEALLMKALKCAGDQREKVIVLSIPDWGVTPFAEGRDRQQVAGEIDAFNRVNEAIAAKHHIYYINVTPWTREAAADPSLLTGDKLHPSAREYERWARRIADYVLNELRPGEGDPPGIGKHEGYH